MNFSISRAGSEDYPVILRLIRELADFVGKPHSVVNTEKKMLEDEQHFTCFLAKGEDGEDIGMALVFFAYSTWVGKMLYLEDLYVREPYRGKGIGRALLNEIFSIARATDCKRVRWQTLRWNTPAVEFYKSLGAQIDEEAMNCDFEEDQIASFGM